jgi:hypothetical protein
MEWLQKVQKLLNQTQMVVGGYIYWTGHHAAAIKTSVHPKCISALLPLIHENAHTPAMVCYSMTLVQHGI